tara:strand:+ start:402 stop:614 length:213 start_codon:yes stop_codon:yes gene_type:complete
MFASGELKSKEDQGWYWMTYDQCHANMNKIRDILRNHAWHICALSDGKVAGPGYNYDYQRWDKGLAHGCG